MIQPLYTDKQRQELRRHQILMHGGRSQQYKKQLSKEAIEQIKKDYYKMYYGLTSVNWSKKGTKLGTAWQKALEQMEAYIKTKSKVPNNPVYECLVDIYQEHKKRVVKHIMMCQGRESEDVLPDEFLEMFARGEKRAVEGKSALDNVYKAYMPKQQTQEKTKMIPQDIRKLLLQEYLSKQRVA